MAYLISLVDLGQEYTLPLAAGRFTTSGELGINIDDYTLANLGSGMYVNYVPFSKLDAAPALSVLGNTTNASATVGYFTAGTDGHVLRRSGTTLGFGTIATAGLADNSVTYAKLQNSAAGLTVLGRSANSAGAFAEIAAGTDGHILRRSGTTLGFGTIATAGIADTAVTYAKIANGTGLSVIGRSANTAGVNADIAAATDGHVLRRSGTTLTFGQVVTAGIATNAITTTLITDANVTYAKIQNGAARSVLGRSANSAGVMSDIQAPSARYFLASDASNASIGFRFIDTPDLPSGNWVGNTTGTTVFGTGFSCANVNTVQATGYTITLPTAGKYRVSLDARLTCFGSAGVCEGFFYNNTVGGGALTARIFCADNVTRDSQFTINEIITTTTANNVIELRIRKGMTSMAGDFVVNSQTYFQYNKIA